MTTNGYKKRSKKYRKWLATKTQQPIGRIKNPFGRLCPNGCGEPGPHFVPPGFGSPGMFICKPKPKVEETEK